MKKKLTPKTIDSLPAAQAKRYEVRDELLIGLLLRVSSRGGKVWYVSTRIHGRVRRIKIGNYPIVSLADAREEARGLLRKVQLNLFLEPQDMVAEPKVPTLGEIVPLFIELYARPRNKDWKGSQSILTKFAALNSKPIDKVRRADIVRVLDEIVASGTPFRANRALAAIKKLFAWCVDRGTIEVNPLVAMRPPTREVARDRVLTDDELVSCWQAADVEGFPFAQCVKMFIMTGQRRGEVSGMRWSELDLEKAVWTIPAKRAKNATQHTVPLAPLALEILNSIPRFLNSDFVLTTTGTTPISGFGRLKDRLDVMVAGPDWRFHDIRRTVATNMAMMGTPPHVIEAVLGGVDKVDSQIGR
jgi:integrase